MVIGTGADRVQAPPTSGTTFRGTAVAFDGPTLRLGAFNIRGGRGTDNRTDLLRTADTVRGAQVVGLNEVHGRGGDDDALTLGHMLDLPSLFAPAERRWWRDSFGNGMLCALPVEGWVRIPLPGTQGAGHRTVLLTRLVWNGRVVNVLVTHIDRTTDRATQLRTVIDLFRSLEPPSVLMGDLNTNGTDEQIKQLISEGATDAIGSILRDRDTPGRIDWVLTRGLSVVNAGIIDQGASDHPFVWAEVR
jgi:endonuclease/exonuclease/phosphatase family metal-dependent hydrolase